MEHKVKIISCWFGELPEIFQLWAYSCSQNKDFEFLLITDQTIKSDYSNLEICTMDLKEVERLIKKKLYSGASVKKAYKLCDFRPAYGVIFEDFLAGYDFWGHCDIDLIFGDIKKFVTDKMLKEYDKVLYLGHLSLYRNCKEINTLFHDMDWKTIYSSSKNFGMDEDQGIYSVFKNKGLPMYEERIFFDIYPFKTYMELDNVINKRMQKKPDENYHNQLFIWHKGGIYRIFKTGGCLKKEEAVYLHMGKGQIKNCSINEPFNTMFFSKTTIFTGFMKSIDSIDMKLINRYNKYSVLRDAKDCIAYHAARFRRRVIRAVNKK